MDEASVLAALDWLVDSGAADDDDGAAEVVEGVLSLADVLCWSAVRDSVFAGSLDVSATLDDGAETETETAALDCAAVLPPPAAPSAVVCRFSNR